LEVLMAKPKGEKLGEDREVDWSEAPIAGWLASHVQKLSRGRKTRYNQRVKPKKQQTDAAH
jgi:hypothetical protein